MVLLLTCFAQSLPGQVGMEVYIVDVKQGNGVIIACPSQAGTKQRELIIFDLGSKGPEPETAYRNVLKNEAPTPKHDFAESPIKCPTRNHQVRHSSVQKQLQAVAFVRSKEITAGRTKLITDCPYVVFFTLSLLPAGNAFVV